MFVPDGETGRDVRSGLVCVLALLCCCSLVAAPVLGGALSPATGSASEPLERPSSASTTEPHASNAITGSPSAGTIESPERTTDSSGVSSGLTIDSELERASADGEAVDVIVRLAEPDVSRVESDRVERALKRHAEISQREVVAYAERTDGVTVRNQFWLSNAVLLEVDTSQVDLESFERFDAVSTLHSNFEVELQETTASAATGATGSMTGSTASGTTATTSTTISTSGSDTTYGLEQINAPSVWDRHETTGEGVKVAVLDTGIDVDHPDLDLYTEDPSDPTYPGGWAEFDSNGNIVSGSEPQDFGDHGTHVSGTIAGGADSGTHIGVAPGVDLLHGAVLTDCDDGCSGTYSQVIEGMQWAVDENADVTSMSLGADGYEERFIDPVRNAKFAGTVVVSSSGNSGDGSSSSPANVYETFAVGASDSNEDVRSFSSGEEIDTAAAWDNPPSDWPDSYVVPNVAAPGSSVLSAKPGGDYTKKSGTSMAAPHVSGAMALLLSLNETLGPTELETTLEETARKPDGSDGQDTRYGYGIIDVKAAADEVALATVEGTVTDAAGQPIENATVDIDGQWNATTDGDGAYALTVEPGNRPVAINATGYHDDTAEFELERGETVAHDATLGFVSLVADQSDLAEANGSTTVTFDVIDLEEITVTLTDDSTIDPGTVSFAIDGHDGSVGANETVTFDESVTNATFNVTVHLADESDLNGTLELDHAVARNGTNESQTLRTGPTSVVPEIYDVGVIGDGDDPARDELRTGLDDELPVAYRLTSIATNDSVSAAKSGDYGQFVVLELPAEDDLLTNPTQEFVDETTANGIGVLYLGGGLDDTDPLTRLENDTAVIHSVQTTDHDGSTVVVETAHPILDGVGTERADVAVLENATTRAWFDAPAARTLASATDDGVLADGPGLEFDRADRQVFLGATPRDGALTDAGRLTLRNAITYLGEGSLHVSEEFDTYGVSGGDAESVTFGVPETGNATVDFADGTTADPSNVTLEVGGRTISPGDEVTVDDDDAANGLAVNVTATENVTGEDVQLALAFDTETATTGTIRFETDPPARYAGTVAVNDDPVRDGLTVSAVVNGTVVGETTTDGGWFGVPDSDGGAGVLEVSGADLPDGTTDEVAFVLEYADAGTTATWQAGDEPRTDLAVAYADPFASATVAAPNWTSAGTEIDVSVGFDSEDARYLTTTEWLDDPAAIHGGLDSEPPWNATYAPMAADEGHLSVGTTLTDLAGETYTVSDRVLVVDGDLARINGTISPATNESTLSASGSNLSGSVFLTPDHGNWTDERTVENGTFEAATEANASTHAAFVESTGQYPIYRTVFDRVVEDGETVDVELEAGHELGIEVYDGSGNPVENASVAVSPIDATATDNATVTRETLTNASGLWTGPSGNGSGATVNGSVTITVTPPDADDLADDPVTRVVSVDEARTETFELPSPPEEANVGGGGGGGQQIAEDEGMSLKPTVLSDGRVMFVLSDAVRGETAGASLSGVRADGVSFTRVDVSASRDSDREVFTLRPGAHDAALPDGTITGATISHDGVDRTVDSTTFAFTVADDAIPAGASADDVVLSLYRNGAWEAVETTGFGNSHRATVSGLPTIAIGVDAEPTFDVVDSRIDPEEVAAGETVTIEATLENTGLSGSSDVTVAVDGDVIATERIELESGERTTISLETTLEETATITVDGTPIGTVTVDGEADSDGDGVPGFGVVPALVAVGLLLGARLRTRS